jgi:LysM domain
LSLFYSISLFTCVAHGRVDNLIEDKKKSDLLQCSAVEKPVNYKVVKDDYLTGILLTFGFKPLYGKMSQVAKVVKLNKIRDPDLIFPDQEIYLPFRCEQDTDKYVLMDRGKDRQIKSLQDPLMDGQVLQENKKVLVSIGTIRLKPIVQPFKKHSSISVGGLYGFQRIDSVGKNNGSTALLLSKPTVGFHLGGGYHWTSRLTTSFNFEHRLIEMERATTGVLTNEKQNTSGLGVDIQYNWTAKFKSILGVNYEERLFVQSIQIGNASLEVYQQPILDLKIEHEVFHYGSLGMDVMLAYRQMLKTTTETANIYNSGEYLMGATFRRQMKKMQVAFQFNYLKGQLKSDLTEQDNTGIEARVGLKMEIGK